MITSDEQNAKKWVGQYTGTLLHQTTEGEKYYSKLKYGGRYQGLKYRKQQAKVYYDKIISGAYDVDYTGQDVVSGNVTGSAVVAYAMQFVGNPYVWGGDSLTNGIDCSHFVRKVYAHFGITTSSGRAKTFGDRGLRVDVSSVALGDVVVQDGHVSIYCGNGKVVEAQGKKYGITCNRTLSKVISSKKHAFLGIYRYIGYVTSSVESNEVLCEANYSNVISISPFIVPASGIEYRMFGSCYF